MVPRIEIATAGVRRKGCSAWAVKLLNFRIEVHGNYLPRRDRADARTRRSSTRRCSRRIGTENLQKLSFG